MLQEAAVIHTSLSGLLTITEHLEAADAAADAAAAAACVASATAAAIFISEADFGAMVLFCTIKEQIFTPQIRFAQT